MAFSIKETRKFLARQRNRLGEYIQRPRRTPPLAQHGLQRSGTNYLNACLRKLRVWPMNEVVWLDRSDPMHKHYRWQHDKSSISPAIAYKWSNDVFVRSVNELNAVAGFPQACNHIVILKDKPDWLASVCNWGMRSDWYADLPQALADLPNHARDYDAYHSFWLALQRREPGRVAVIEHDALREGFETLPEALERIGVKYRVPRGFSGRIDNVPYSATGRRRFVTPDEVRALLDPEQLEFNILPELGGSHPDQSAASSPARASSG